MNRLSLALRVLHLIAHRPLRVRVQKNVKPFYMLLRMYLPKIEVLNGQYEIPGVVRAK